jgi:hypothetical protein
MVKYWSYVATPLFFTVIGFGITALFSASDIQFLDTQNFNLIPAAMAANNQAGITTKTPGAAVASAKAADAAAAGSVVAGATSRTGKRTVPTAAPK